MVSIITTLILSFAILLLVLAFISLSRQKGFWEIYAKDLENIVDEARKVKEDLNFLLDSAVKISEKINDGLQDIIEREDKFEPINAEHITDLNLVNDNKIVNNPKKAEPKESNKIRVYEAARYLGIDSNNLINMLQQMGHSVNNQLNTLDISILDEIEKVKAGLILNDETRKTNINQDMPLLSVSSNETDEVNEKENSKPGNEFFELEDLRNAHPYIAVRVLHEKGYSVKQIAKFLGRGQGEVQILLNLAYRNKAI